MKLKKLLLTIFGFFCLGLGAVGVALPVMPTTPFVLLAAFCFSVSSERFYTWLQKNRVFGPYIENYRTNKGISIWHKIGSIAFLWTGLIISIFMTRAVWIYVLLGIVGICVTTHLLLIKTKRVFKKQIKEESIMKYECVCGYMYDEAVGDPNNGIQPGTKWDDLPDDFVCPLCGLGKDIFTSV